MKKTIIAFVGMLCVAMMLSLGMSNVEAANQNQKTIIMLSKKTKKASKKSRKASKKSKRNSKKTKKVSKKTKKNSKKSRKAAKKSKKSLKKSKKATKTSKKRTKKNTATKPAAVTPVVNPVVNGSVSSRVGTITNIGLELNLTSSGAKINKYDNVSSSNQAVAMCNNKGFLIPIGPGDCAITRNVYSGSTLVSVTTVNVHVDDDNSVLVGCDTSKWQGTINTAKMKSIGIDFAIIQVGHNSVDSQFGTSVDDCRNSGMPFGLYWLITSRSSDEAKVEADTCIDAMQSKGITPNSMCSYPLYLDMEKGNSGQSIFDGLPANNALRRERVAMVMTAFINELHARGFSDNQLGIYANLDWYNNYIDSSFVNTYKDHLWFARPSFEQSSTNRATFNNAPNYPQMLQVGAPSKVLGTQNDSDSLDINYYYK